MSQRPDPGSGRPRAVDAFHRDTEACSRLVFVLVQNNFRVLNTLQDNWKHPRILQARAVVTAQNKCATSLPK